MKSSGYLYRLTGQQGQLFCKAGIPESHHLKSAGPGIKDGIQPKCKIHLTLSSWYINTGELFALLFGFPLSSPQSLSFIWTKSIKGSFLCVSLCFAVIEMLFVHKVLSERMGLIAITTYNMFYLSSIKTINIRTKLWFLSLSACTDSYRRKLTVIAM